MDHRPHRHLGGGDGADRHLDRQCGDHEHERLAWRDRRGYRLGSDAHRFGERGPHLGRPLVRHPVGVLGTRHDIAVGEPGLLEQADEAYKLFDQQTEGKGVFLMN